MSTSRLADNNAVLELQLDGCDRSLQLNALKRNCILEELLLRAVRRRVAARIALLMGSAIQTPI